jgi:transposase
MLVQQHPVCRRLTALEGIGPVCSVLLYATLGTGEAFANGRQFSAYLGLTPKQFSSGGKVNLVGISKRVANRRLRAVLIQGARAYVYHMREPKTAKDRWLLAIVERSGKCKVAVALANKNVRTAWAMLTQNTEYQHYPLAARNAARKEFSERPQSDRRYPPR